MENEGKTSEGSLEPYNDILEILKADRPPRNYQEANDVAFEIEQLALFFKDVTFLLSNEDGGGSYLTEHKTLRAFRAVSQIFDIVGALSENIKDWIDIEIGRELRAKGEIKRIQRESGGNDLP